MGWGRGGGTARGCRGARRSACGGRRARNGSRRGTGALHRTTTGGSRTRRRTRRRATGGRRAGRNRGRGRTRARRHYAGSRRPALVLAPRFRSRRRCRVREAGRGLGWGWGLGRGQRRAEAREARGSRRGLRFCRCVRARRGDTCRRRSGAAPGVALRGRRGLVGLRRMRRAWRDGGASRFRVHAPPVSSCPGLLSYAGPVPFARARCPGQHLPARSARHPGPHVRARHSTG